MAKNLKTLRTQVRFKSGLKAGDFTNAEIDIQLNDAYYTLAGKIADLNEDFFEEQKAKFALALNSALYHLPTDLLKFKQLRLSYSTPSDESDYNIATAYDPAMVKNVSVDEEDISTSTPKVDITNNYMRIKPTPTTAIANGGEIYYIARPSALTLTADTPVIPTEFHDLLAIYAAKEGCFRFGKTTKWKILKAEWLEGIESVKEELSVRNIDNPKRMRNFLEDRNNRTTTELW